MSKLKIVFMGTPDFSVPTLKALHNNPLVDLKHIISMPDRPSGRGHQLKSPEVIEYAKQNNLSFFQTKNINQEKEFLNSLKEQDIDAIVVLAFAQFLGDNILNLPRLGCFNIHTSLLPKYRGAAPIQYAILNGDTTTGVSIQKMVKKMDAGDICFSKEVSIEPNETGGELYNKLKEQAGKSIKEFIEMLAKNALNFAPQDESKVSFAPTLKKTDGLLDFEKKSATQIINQVRALSPWPGTYSFLNNKRLKILKVTPSTMNLKPNQLETKNSTLEVGCADGAIRLLEVQLEGKRACSDTELLNGLRETHLLINNNPQDNL